MEICDLVGLYILSLLKEIIPNVGLYRDDGLAVSSATNRQIDVMKKKICKTKKSAWQSQLKLMQKLYLFRCYL